MRTSLALVIGLALGYGLALLAGPVDDAALAAVDAVDRPPAAASRLERALGIRMRRLDRRARKRCIAEGGARQALVVDNVDPEGRNRILVRFPFHDDEDAPVWVRLNAPFVNPNQLVTPPVGSTVLVVFEQGDTQQGNAVGLVAPPPE